MKRSMHADRSRPRCAATFPAQAQKQQFDLSTITCKQFFEYNKENLSLMLMWLDGYYSRG